MTIERRETFLFGLIKRKPKVLPPGAVEVVYKLPMLTQPVTIGETIEVTTPDDVVVTFHGVFMGCSTRYHKETINKAKIVSLPSVTDAFLLARQRAYYWRPSGD